MSNDMNKMIGYNLKAVRVERGWSQAFVAREVGISIRSISRLETGRSVSKKLVKKLCMFYRISINSLYKEEDASKNTVETVDLIPEDVVFRLLLSSSFVGEVQRETVLRFNDSIQKNAVMFRGDIEAILSDVISKKQSYTLVDMIACGLAVNRRTLQNISKMQIV